MRSYNDKNCYIRYIMLDWYKNEYAYICQNGMHYQWRLNKGVGILLIITCGYLSILLQVGGAV